VTHVLISTSPVLIETRIKFLTILLFELLLIWTVYMRDQYKVSFTFSTQITKPNRGYPIEKLLLSFQILNKILLS
jgi:acyl-CoA thioesterase FadM